MKTMNELQEEIGNWQAETFKENNSTRGKANHLKHEADEVIAALAKFEANHNEESFDHLAEEVGDVIILALGIAAQVGFFADLSVDRKMKKNRARKWNPPDADGVCGHIKGA